jgi:MoaA/NifB/PqqE/SkfB family radical SAM enzyme
LSGHQYGKRKVVTREEDILEEAWRLAKTRSHGETVGYVALNGRKLTRRGIMWTGTKCNLRCYFCYFKDRRSDSNHPEHAFMSMDKAKKIATTLVEFYGNTSVDIEGGEPTLWDGIVEYVRFCRSIGLDPTVITNGQRLSKIGVVEDFREAGVRDFIVSIHALGATYDRVVGRKGAHARQMAALRNLQKAGVPFRINAVMLTESFKHLPLIAELGIRTGAKVLNYLTYNPYDDQRRTGVRRPEGVPRYSDLEPMINEALDRLASAGVEGNVRHYPICMVAKRHRRSVYTFRQIPYDPHENDFASWAWTGEQPQRMREGKTTEPFVLGRRFTLGAAGRYARVLSQTPLAPFLWKAKWALDRIVTGLSSNLENLSLEEKYQEDARLRAHDHCGYVHGEKCRVCDARDICDGFHGDYARMHGTDEAMPIREGARISNPLFYIQEQTKFIHPNDLHIFGG